MRNDLYKDFLAGDSYAVIMIFIGLGCAIAWSFVFSGIILNDIFFSKKKLHILHRLCGLFFCFFSLMGVFWISWLTFKQSYSLLLSEVFLLIVGLCLTLCVLSWHGFYNVIFNQSD
jgi:hypothetical protein